MTTTTTPAHRRHDISDRAWETIAPHLSGGPGKVGCPAEDNRRFINAVFSILRTGAPWRDLPPGLRTPEHHRTPLRALAEKRTVGPTAGRSVR